MSVNKWIGIGNLTRDPELKYTPAGKAVCNFSVACNEKFGDNERTEYVNIVAWEKLAEICGKYLEKGNPVYIEGRLATRSYVDRDGNKKYVTEVVAFQMQMLGGGKRQETEEGARPQATRAATPHDDDDIPF